MTIQCKNIPKTLVTAGENTKLHAIYGHQNIDVHRELGEGKERKTERKPRNLLLNPEPKGKERTDSKMLTFDFHMLILPPTRVLHISHTIHMHHTYNNKLKIILNESKHVTYILFDIYPKDSK